jgi:hypothetical protein
MVSQNLHPLNPIVVSSDGSQRFSVNYSEIPEKHSNYRERQNDVPEGWSLRRLPSKNLPTDEKFAICGQNLPGMGTFERLRKVSDFQCGPYYYPVRGLALWMIAKAIASVNF